MTEHFRSKPENATLDAHAFAPLDDIWEYTAIPVLDMSEHLDDGTPICGQFTYADGMAALKRLGLEPLTTYDVETLHDLATRGQCIELPAFTSTATAETSLAWRKVSDKANRDNMLRLGWKPGMRVCNFGKGWIAGAPAGRAWLMGWWVPRVEAYGITERHGPGFIQPRPMPGSAGRHSAHDQADDGTNLWGKRRRSDTATNPPSGSVVGSVVSAVASAAAQAADVLRGLLASNGANPPEPTRTKPMVTFPADLPCVNSVVRAAGYRPTRSAKVRLVVLHTAECAETAKSAEAVAGYFASLKDRAASAHFCVDSDSIVQCVPLSGTAWAAPGANDDGVQIELAGYAGQGAAGWADAYSVAMLDRAATLVAQLCERYSLPVAYVDEAGLLAGLAGVTTHAAVSRAWRRSTHTDPGPTFPLAAFLDSVRAKMST